ncbi:hypothetical protein Asi02nite_39630 [Asanoa siamensis]|uniref:Transposase Helix-turn-helix domain-containing protein n=1 Tax=Asanoa siamensis TaxID=926357 RepID=A0ABQ4CT36_9ACTN|nr:hypothetical protein Asi02nite_39630 [Asanoa siamensis]
MRRRGFATTAEALAAEEIARGDSTPPAGSVAGERVLPVAAYWRTNVTVRPIGLLREVSHSAAHRVIDTLGPLLALAPVRRRPVTYMTSWKGFIAQLQCQTTGAVPPGLCRCRVAGDDLSVEADPVERRVKGSGVVVETAQCQRLRSAEQHCTSTVTLGGDLAVGADRGAARLW